MTSEAKQILDLFARVESAEFFVRHFQQDRDRVIVERDAALAKLSDLENTKGPDLAAIRAHAYRCGFADGQEGKVTPPEPQVIPTITVCRHCTGRAWDNEPLIHAEGCPLEPKPAPVPDFLKGMAAFHEPLTPAAMMVAEAAARAERERIAVGFIHNAMRPSFEPGEVVLAAWDGAGLDPLTTSESIRAALEPKP